MFRITKGNSAALQFACVALEHPTLFKQGVGNIVCMLCAREVLQGNFKVTYFPPLLLIQESFYVILKEDIIIKWIVLCYFIVQLQHIYPKSGYPKFMFIFVIPRKEEG